MYFLRVEIDILSGQENFDQCISRICFSPVVRHEAELELGDEESGRLAPLEEDQDESS